MRMALGCAARAVLQCTVPIPLCPDTATTPRYTYDSTLRFRYTTDAAITVLDTTNATRLGITVDNVRSARLGDDMDARTLGQLNTLRCGGEHSVLVHACSS